MNIHTQKQTYKIEDWLTQKAATEDQLYIQTFITEWLQGKKEFRLFTSGSTGKPKEIVISRAQMEHSAKLTCAYFGLEKGDKIFLTLNPRVVGGTMIIVRALVAKMDLIIVPPASNPFENTEIPQPSFISMVPMQLQKILEQGDANTLQILQAHKAILLGGGPVSAILEKQIATHQLPVWLGYGMTETVSHIALRKLGVGQNTFVPMEGVELKLDDRSCLAIKSAVTCDQWIQTNDVVQLSEAGFVWQGRADFTINTGGVKVQIETLEKKLAGYITTSLLNDLIIFPMDDERLGQQVCAVAFSDEAVDLASLAKAVKPLVAKYEYPRRYFYIQGTIPRTLSGKVDRKAIISMVHKIPIDQSFHV